MVLFHQLASKNTWAQFSMPVKVEPQAEPIPGYRLINRLGGGGFGEVWKAEAPGGLYKAIKFVFGDLRTLDKDGSRAEQELKALSRVKSVHHPYILSLERFDIVDGQLMIVMELADKTLWDRFRECRTQGLSGIPREELLKYLQESAEALDLMNTQYQLQHLDIKPQNIFLVHNHIKVADFGLVKDLEGMAATVTGGVTPVYAAPETFDGWVSRFSDQYSLAIVFQELLTGQRPFSGQTMRQLVLQHLQGEPDLSALSMGDRPIIAKALSKNPDERFPSCQEMIQFLRQPGSASIAIPVKPQNGSEIKEELISAPDPEDLLTTRSARKLSSKKAEKPQDKWEGIRRPPKTPSAKTPPPKPSSDIAEPGFGQAARSEPISLQKSKNYLSSLLWQNDAELGPGILQPALVIGLGKLGIQVLQHLREMLHGEFGHLDAFPHLRLVGIDTDKETVQAACQGSAPSTLRPHEVFQARLQRPAYYLNPRKGKSLLEGWLNSQTLFRSPRHQQGAGVRALGRLAFIDNYRVIYRRLENELQQCFAPETLEQSERITNRGFRSRFPRVYVVASLAGHTGSGMILDVGYLMRHLVKLAGQRGAEVVGTFLLPPDKEEFPQHLLANTYAALLELNHYSSRGVTFSALYPMGEGGDVQSFKMAGPPYHRCQFISWPEITGSGRNPLQNALSEGVRQASRALFYDLASPLGRAVDKQRREEKDLGQSFCRFHTMNLFRIFWPRRPLMTLAAKRLCHNLVQHWLRKEPGPLAESMSHWTAQNWEILGWRPEQLLQSFQEKFSLLLKDKPENLVNNLLEKLSPSLTGEDNLNPGPVVKALAEIEKLLGLPEECKTSNIQVTCESGMIEKALEQVAAELVEDGVQKLAEMVVQLIEDPNYRLVGAEEALRQFSVIAEKALAGQEALAKEIRERTVNLYQRIQNLLEKPTSGPVQSSLWKSPFSRRNTPSQPGVAAELRDLVLNYPKCRLQSLILQQLIGLFVSLRGHLSDQVREVGMCRQRLKELQEQFRENPKNQAILPNPNVVSAHEKCLLPKGCLKWEDILGHWETALTQDHLLTFDQKVENLLREQFGALVQVCMGPAYVVGTLAPAMLRLAEDYVAPGLESINLSRLILGPEDAESGQREQAFQAELSAAFDRAAPAGNADTVAHMGFLTLPVGNDEERFLQLAQEVLPQVQVVGDDHTDEMVLYRESSHFVAPDSLYPPDEPACKAYQQFLGKDPLTVHCREDVDSWAPAPATS